MARAREARLAEFEIRRGTDTGDGRQGDLVASGRLDAEVANWFAQLKPAPGVDDTYSAYCDGELVWQVKPDDDEQGSAVSPKVAAQPRDLDSIDTVLAERQHEVDRLTLRATALEQQLVSGENRLRQLQEDLSGKQLDLARERERHTREIAALDADLERRRQLDAHDRVRLANDLEVATKAAQAERARMAADLEIAAKSYQAQGALLVAAAGDQVKAARAQIADLQGVAKDINEIAAAEASAAAASKAAATNAFVEEMESINQLREAAADSLRPEEPDAGKTEIYKAAGEFIKKDLAGVLLNMASIFGPRRRAPGTEDAEEASE